MRIAIVSAAESLGGAGIAARDVARGMAELGHDVLFVAGADEERSFERDGYSVRWLPTGPRLATAQYFNPVAVRRLSFALRTFSPDALNFHNINLRTFSVSALRLATRWPTAWTLHDVWPVCIAGWPIPPDCVGMFQGCRSCPTWPNWQARLNRRLKERVFRDVPITLICPSEWMARMMQCSALGTKPNHVVRIGFERDRYRRDPSARATLGVPSDETTILFSGGRTLRGVPPAERKGWSVLRDALPRVARSAGRVRLLYVGDPIDVGDELGLPVTFLGPMDRGEMPRAYSASDIFVLPTLADNAPMTVPEAMGCGALVVASRVGGIPEVIEHGESGLLCAPRDAGALADALIRAINSPAERHRMTNTARETFDTQLGIETMWRRYESVFRGLAE